MMNASAAVPSSPVQELFLGDPLFSDTDLAQLYQSQGAKAAWLAAYQRYGHKAPLAARGCFALAFSPKPGCYFLAVDRFARQSLCYQVSQGQIYFAAKANEVPGPKQAVELQAIFDYFYFHVIPAPRTIFQHIFRVPAAHYLLFEQGQARVAPYWLPEFNEHPGQSFASLKDEFLSVVEQGVKEQLGAGRTGCYLSGGTDSSTVAGMVRRVTGQGASTFSIGFEAEGYDEMDYARIAARQFKTDHHEYYVTPEDLVRSIADVAASFDQPFGNSSVLPGYYCAKFAKEHGMEKMLAGDGGDELFGGNSRYAKQKVFDWYNIIPSPLRKLLLEPVAPLFAKVPLLKKVDSYIEQAVVPMPHRLYQYGLLERLGMDHIFPSAVLKQFDTLSPQRQQQEIWDMAGSSSFVNHMLTFDWRYTLADSDLPKVCGSAHLAGIPVGFPLLDERLLEFSLKLPSSYKVKGLKLRWFFKEALRGFLPDEIITKKKHGFGLPFGVWSVKKPALKKLAEESVRGLADRGIVQHPFIDTLLKEHLPAYPGYYGEMVWIMMMMEQWFRAHQAEFKA